MEHTLQPLELSHYRALVAGAEVIEADRWGEKVLRLADGSLLKLFRRKRLLSSAAWHPYALRFAQNCTALAANGIACPTVLAVYRVKALERDIVHYDPLAGITLREVFKRGTDADPLRAKLGRYMAELHTKGIYFRSAHLNNIILTPEGSMGLIDVADMRTFNKPLPRSLRVRNFRHVLRVKSDRKFLLNDNDRIFIESYLHCQPSPEAWQLAGVIAKHAQTLGLAG
jgi:tRNA A-37 threonylcarbamoyl transferase component Bud32